MTIPTTPLVAACAIGSTLSAASVAEAVGRGLRSGGSAAPDLVALEIEREDRRGALARHLADAHFDSRMLRARAVILACARLEQSTLAGSAMFEIATRARQAGVPAYAIAADNRLSLFDARVLDLQTILQAGGARALAAAGRRLAAII